MSVSDVVGIDRPASEAVKAFYTTPTRAQRSLGTEHKSEAALFSRMLNAFEQDPRTSALERTARIRGTATYPSETFYADRTYQRADKRNNQGASATDTPRTRRKPFKCYICEKEGCRWSNHTKE
ncbi:hypothetical protein SEPCBS57363_001929 [Sporothrix epigloea]|uniref:Uncharacterized protein n=1 Tax=Sporothrix epigloea TaxID=1892477 RepID=A0ABP0DCZ7_9PEZI